MSKLRIDHKRMREDLRKCVGGEDGLTLEHLELSDLELVLEFAHVYGQDALEEYVIEDEEAA